MKKKTQKKTTIVYKHLYSVAFGEEAQADIRTLADAEQRTVAAMIRILVQEALSARKRS